MNPSNRLPIIRAVVVGSGTTVKLPVPSMSVKKACFPASRSLKV